MAVIHVFKDGTVTNELKDVYVPKNVVQQIIQIAERKEEYEKKKVVAKNT